MDMGVSYSMACPLLLFLFINTSVFRPIMDFMRQFFGQASCPVLKWVGESKSLQVPSEFVINKPCVEIGRDPEADLVLSSSLLISRKHARLFREETATGAGSWVLECTGANGGVFVNDVRCERCVINDGDRIGFGVGHEGMLGTLKGALATGGTSVVSADMASATQVYEATQEMALDANELPLNCPSLQPRLSSGGGTQPGWSGPSEEHGPTQPMVIPEMEEEAVGATQEMQLPEEAHEEGATQEQEGCYDSSAESGCHSPQAQQDDLETILRYSKAHFDAANSNRKASLCSDAIVNAQNPRSSPPRSSPARRKRRRERQETAEEKAQRLAKEMLRQEADRKARELEDEQIFQSLEVRDSKEDEAQSKVCRRPQQLFHSVQTRLLEKTV
eukprot:g5549.t1